jgi:hypothetical protein
MKRRGTGAATETRALECALAAIAAFLAADGIRSALEPVWTMMKLLFGT